MKEQELKRYGKCLVQEEIGSGARSTVYLAWHETLQIPVALKVIEKVKSLDTQGFSERVLREARLAAQLRHENIMRVFDCGETKDCYYVVLEFIEGETCKDKIDRDGPFEWRRAVRVMRDVADGLRYAHQKAVIHRDIKPENIMIDAEGNTYIADLGLAKQVMSTVSSATAESDVLGTPYYMSPEQVRQPADVDFRSDIYSLGATLYHMVTGEVPFEGPTPFQIMAKHLKEPVPSPGQKVPELPEALCALVLRAMAKDPDERQQSYDELIRELDGLLAGEPERELAEEGAPDISVAEGPEAEELGKEEGLPKPEPIPFTLVAEHVQAKLAGMLAILAYAFFLVCVYIILVRTGLVPALVATAGLIVVSIWWGYSVLQVDSGDTGPEDWRKLNEDLCSALSRLSARMGLPPPELRLSRRNYDACFAYSFFSRKGVVHVPGRWIKEMNLSEREKEALLAQCLAGISSGDSDLRLLLALPVAVLKAGRAVIGWLLSVSRSWSPRLRWQLVQGLSAAGILGICAIIVLLFLLSTWCGLLVVVFVGMLALVGSFERSSRCAGDLVAAKVLSGPDAVSSLVIVSALAGVDGYRLIRQSGGQSTSQVRPGDFTPEERQRLVEGIASHYAQAKGSPNLFQLARNLFSPVPLAAERLNRLAGLVRGRPPIFMAVMLAKSVCASLTGRQAKETMDFGQLAATKRFVVLGMIAGVLLVATIAALFARGAMYYAAFLAGLSMFGTTLGFAVGYLLCQKRVSAGGFGAAITVTSVFFACTTAVGFCLVGGRNLSALALQFPVVLVLTAFISSVSGGLFVRLAARLGVVRARAAPESD